MYIVFKIQHRIKAAYLLYILTSLDNIAYASAFVLNIIYSA